jgi:acyl-CoA synthetase (AMP-forming)/AMP-acid ligase II/thioesterase domain-containing protein
MYQTIPQILEAQAKRSPDSIAILDLNRAPLTYRSLYSHVAKVVEWLNAYGIGNNDRVAIVLPNGPEMATAFLGVAAGAASAPLNPAYRATEFDFYLSDLNAKALIIQGDFDSPAREVAQARGIPILEISSTPQDEAGIFHPANRKWELASVANYSMPEDVALVLHTSGTTSRPKIVPLTQKNICTSADNIKATLQLTPQDRCLNVMPLFHIHGLMAAVLASLAAGASIVCTPGFQADQFFECLSAFRPTWYTAVPTMHQSILSRVDANRNVIAESSLRFLRSSSASLPPQVMKELEEVFRAPMIEAYGMTEASHQMASNPLPPLPRKPGTVGVGAGPQVRIMDEAGNFLSAGESGEIVIRGENVTLGYENNPAANQTSFTNGWFRTGDQGVMDADGYLSITGRLKEMVNRGGEKIAPREVDEALLDHPAVAQAVAFALPHPTLGEDLGAAVVLRQDAKSSERELREFAFSRLADYKVPSQIVIVNEIPKGPTGKLQRIGLAEKLGSSLKTDYVPPRDALEEALAGIWAETLKLERVGICDNFFALGGDSLSAASVTLSIAELVDKQLHPSIIFRAPTIEQLSGLLTGDTSEGESHLVAIQPHGAKKPLFLVPGHGGDVFTFVELARNIQPDQPVYVFRFPEPARKDDNVANLMLRDMAATYVKEMRSLQPEGPYQLGGFCYGGELAIEMAQLLHAQGQRTGMLAIIYTYLPGAVRIAGLRQRIRYHVEKFMERSFKEKINYMLARVRNVLGRMIRKIVPTLSRQLIEVSQEATVYFPKYYPGKVTLFRPMERDEGFYYDPKMGWEGLTDEMDLYDIPGNKSMIFQSPNVQVLAEHLKDCLDHSTN